ncbi:Protein of unknown function [Bacillus mycoides]|nr:Protein of unknown function [Bacillus mycoides]
MKKQLAAS